MSTNGPISENEVLAATNLINNTPEVIRQKYNSIINDFLSGNPSKKNSAALRLQALSPKESEDFLKYKNAARVIQNSEKSRKQELSVLETKAKKLQQKLRQDEVVIAGYDRTIADTKAAILHSQQRKREIIGNADVSPSKPSKPSCLVM